MRGALSEIYEEKKQEHTLNQKMVEVVDTSPDAVRTPYVLPVGLLCRCAQAVNLKSEARL